MAQRITIAPEPEIENDSAATVVVCRHRWVIQPADGPVSIGRCQICDESREFKNYVESATWGDSRISNKNSAASEGAGSTSDDEDSGAGSRRDGDEAESEG